MADKKYFVKQGDCFSSIAKKHGFLLKTLWEHPSNAPLKQKRKSPNILFPGDVIYIPEPAVKEFDGSTEEKHVFRLEKDKTDLQLRLLREDEPRGNLKFSLQIGKETIEGTTDGDGWIKQKNIPAEAKTAKLILQPETEGAEEYELLLGHLDPLEENSGVADRLQNLGFYFGFDNEEKTDDEALKFAVEGFQNKYELPETGEVDAAMLDKLKQIHGS